MAYRLIYHGKIVIQFIILDYILGLSFENIDLRTLEGMRRYKEIFGSYPRNHNFSQHNNKSKGHPPKSLPDIDFLFINFNERNRRLFAGFLAKTYGHGGVEKAARQTGLDMKTVRKGKTEVDIHAKLEKKSRIRRQGGGRHLKIETDKRYKEELNAILEDESAGDPMSEKKWMRKTLRWIKKTLEKKKVKVGTSTIRKDLKGLGISLKKNMKYKNNRNHPDREEQFQYLNKLKNEFLSKKITISIDTKKKEKIGNFKNDGKTWRKNAYKVLDHDFPSLGKGKLIPFGIYDLKNNMGYVNCGTSYETSEFAVDSLCWWWEEYGQKLYPNQSELLIFCDSGGANGYSRRKWKWDLQTKLADHFGLTVTVCHYPSGTSKYNPIEHKLFSFISLNWAGEPLTSYDKALAFIKSTKTEKGLRVEAILNEKQYERGLKVSKEQMESLNIERAKVCPKWNYTLKPREKI